MEGGNRASSHSNAARCVALRCRRNGVHRPRYAESASLSDLVPSPPAVGACLRSLSSPEIRSRLFRTNQTGCKKAEHKNAQLGMLPQTPIRSVQNTPKQTWDDVVVSRGYISNRPNRRSAGFPCPRTAQPHVLSHNGNRNMHHPARWCGLCAGRFPGSGTG